MVIRLCDISLNPCFNGRYSLRKENGGKRGMVGSLNPCFNGRYSLSLQLQSLSVSSFVLILVLMEDTH